jgi:Holliday junction resolvasome RuvABC ATP-dependent DNA helicase subunit
MTAPEYVSIALSCWIYDKLNSENDFAREGLPAIDVEIFFQQLVACGSLLEGQSFKAEEFSIAISGLGVNTTDMQVIAQRVGLTGIIEFADDLHVAAEWRNNRSRHPRTIALAGNYNAGVHTLGHYARPASSDLARLLLEDARENLSTRVPASPEIHRHLLSELLKAPELESLLSLESCSEFLARWDELRPKEGNRAPLLALPALGLLVDEGLFEEDHISKRLALNLTITQQIRTMRTSALQALPRRYRNPTRKQDVVDAVTAVQEYLTAIQSGNEGKLSLATAKTVVRPPKDERQKEDALIEDDSLENEDHPPSVNIYEPVWTDQASDALIEGRDEDLVAIADAIEQGWEAFNEVPSPEIEIFATLPSNQQDVNGSLSVDQDMLEWIGAFCNETNWGGLLDTTETSLRLALNGASERSPIFVQPQQAIVIEGEPLSLDALLVGWDEDLPSLVGRNTHLVETWQEFRAVRSGLLPHLGKLIYNARAWLDGRPLVLESVRRYLALAAELYREVQENYFVMTSNSPVWARSVLEILLALDIVQVRIRLPNGKIAAKAVLLPTHPLHLWRNERLSTLLRGLNQSTNLEESDRVLLRKELERPEQFLSVVRLGSIPAGRGLNQLLPLTSSSEFAGLPVFENLINACSGSDGAAELRNALDQYVLLNPNHSYPLRLALINPPRPELMLTELVGLLNDPRYRGGQKLSAVNVAIYATSQHADRLRAALSFSDPRKEDDVQEKVASGRLNLHIDKSCLDDEPELHDIVSRIRKRPCHLTAIFDESTIRLRQRGAKKSLPMSPFCIRYEVQVDQRAGTIELRPEPGESPFSEFLLLMNELEGNQRDATPHAYADAEALAETADEILQGNMPASRWLFLADRALPSEAGMQSVRIWEKRAGMRDTFLATRDFNTLARLIRPVFSRCNLTVTPEHMERLLHQGARLLGSGLLEIIKRQDGLPDNKKVIGFAGLLLAARDFQRRLPGALVLSVDHPLARLWLRTGSKILNERCDLLVLWKDESCGEFHLIAAEVKTSDDDQLNGGQTRHAKAVEQIDQTLDALKDGLDAAASRQTSPLAIPRCEMLKQTLVRAALSRSGDAAADRSNRRRWGAWLTSLFSPQDQDAVSIKLSGCVVSVLLRRAAAGLEENIASSPQWALRHRVLGEREVDELLQWESSANSATNAQVSPKSALRTQHAEPEAGAAPVSPSPTSFRPIESAGLTLSGGGNEVPASAARSPHTIPGGEEGFGEVWRSGENRTTETSVQPIRDWPPAVNKLGMIGQYQEVDLLVKQAVFSKNMNVRFSDKLLVGPAGVGKSTLARKIGELLLNREPVFFNGSDLRRPTDLPERLAQEALLSDELVSGAFQILPCLIFIDEVHGIASSVATALLSAMDDKRVTSIDGNLYDFNRVIFLLATTDQGKLSEAFQSRPNKTALRPYNLHELAGIVWLHGKECLDGSELTKEACYEIAARVRCSPRRAVRELGEVLRPHFFHQAMEINGGKTPSLRELACLMTRENIAVHYEEQGIDFNGLDNTALRYLTYLSKQGPASEATLSQALGLPNKRDFVEVSEYLTRLGLIEISSGGRRLTREGKKYLNSNPLPDLRERISRAI